MAQIARSHKRKRASADEGYSKNGVKSDVVLQAEEVQANLTPEFPSIIKCMRPSHVTGGFWLGLPSKFCDKNLPKQDTTIFLEDENGVVSETKYLAEKMGLSAGWRGFSIAHNLIEKDVLVFHLVQPNKFKVYIVRANGSGVVSGALGLLNLDFSKKQAGPVHEEILLSFNGEELEDQYKQLLPMEINSSHQSQNEREDLGFEISDGVRFSESDIDFKEVKSFKDFGIQVGGLVITSELSKHLQTKYYKLCCSQKSFIHDGLLEGLNYKLMAGVIAETINISDAIAASKISTSLKNFANWERTLKSFQTLGMNVTFLLTRLEQLSRLASVSRRCQELKLEREEAEKEMKILDVKLSGVKAKIVELDNEIETINESHENLEVLFQKIAEEPW